MEITKKQAKEIKQMKIIPFRIEASKEEDNYSDVYAFLIQGNSKEAYQVEIEIDSLNDLGITDTRCTCPHFTFRQLECKHIQKAKEILKEFKIETETIKSANKLGIKCNKCGYSHGCHKNKSCLEDKK